MWGRVGRKVTFWGEAGRRMHFEKVSSTPSPYRLIMVKDSHILESLNPSPWEEGFVGRDIVMRLEVKKNFNSFPLWGRIYREG